MDKENFLNFLIPQFLHLLNGDNNSIYFTGLCEINELTHLSTFNSTYNNKHANILPTISTLRCHMHNQGSFDTGLYDHQGRFQRSTPVMNYYKHCFLKQISASYLRDISESLDFFSFLHIPEFLWSLCQFMNNENE